MATESRVCICCSHGKATHRKLVTKGETNGDHSPEMKTISHGIPSRMFSRKVIPCPRERARHACRYLRYSVAPIARWLWLACSEEMAQARDIIGRWGRRDLH